MPSLRDTCHVQVTLHSLLGSLLRLPPAPGVAGDAGFLWTVITLQTVPKEGPGGPQLGWWPHGTGGSFMASLASMLPPEGREQQRPRVTSKN